MIFDPGKMNKRVDIYRGDTLLLKRVSASIMPVRGREYFNAHMTESKANATITIRYRPGIDEGCTVVYRDKVYDVESVVDPDEQHESLELYVVSKRRGSTPPIKPGTKPRDDEEWEP